MICLPKLFLAFSLGAICSAPAAIIGPNPPAQPLTSARLAALPAAQQPAWQEYLAGSTRQLQADQAFLKTEMRAQDINKIIPASTGKSLKYLTEKNPAGWYRQPEARRLADIVVSFQTPAGGWSKNLDLSGPGRVPGQGFAADTNWSYIGTFDNDATTTELRFLALVAAADSATNSPYRQAFQRGLDYIFAAQFPNGGWPQVWPLEGGYHDGITYNDGAMLHVLELLRDVAAGRDEFAFVPAAMRARAAASFQRGLDCLLATQIVTNGRRTVWGQQYDPLTLQPAAARNYEMPSQSSGESGDIVLFLMRLPNPDSNVVAAVAAAVAWFEKTKITGQAFKSTGSDGRQLLAAPASGPIWARYYEIGTDKPIFGDRDRSIHDTVAEISKERRNGYAWFKDTPKRVLEHYPRWHETHAP